MKKLLILIILLFSLTGCYDYKEINNLGIISAIGIDYQDNKYIVTLEVLNDQIAKDSVKLTSYIKKGTGPTLTSAVEDAADKIAHQANYTHVKLLLLSENIITNKFKNIIDFFIRSTYFRENFYILSTIKNTPKEILETTTEESPIASTSIINSLESNVYSSNNAVLKSFDLILEEIITFGIDTCFTNISLNDKEFIVDGLSLFKNTNYAGNINNENVKIYNILRNEYYRPTFSKTYGDSLFTISLLTGKPNIKVTNKNIKVTGTLSGKIMDNQTEYNIRNLQTIENINKDFSEILNEKIIDFLKEIQDKKSDILGLSRNYYQKNRKKDANFWQDIPIISTTKFQINKKGLIYEVNYEN